MLKHYLTIALRNLFKNKTSSIVNITGLAVGYMIAILIALFIYDELSYDRFHAKVDRIFRINADFLVNGSSFHVAHVPAPLGPALAKEYPKIEAMARIKPESVVVRRGSELFEENNSFYADTGLFNIFDITIIEGNAEVFLRNPGAIVISKSMALKYFGNTSVLGKSITLNNEHQYKIDAVIEDMPRQSHIHFDFLRSMGEDPDLPSRGNIWANVGYTTYIVTQKNVTPETVNSYLDELTKRYAEPQLKNFINSTLDDIQNQGGHFRFEAFPLSDIHLRSSLLELEPNGDMKYIYMLGSISLFIVVIACFNYVNLTTAQAADRAKGVGVRKVLGSKRSQIVCQFLMESALIAMVTIIISFALTHITLPFFNELVGKEMHLFNEHLRWFLLTSILLIVFIGLLASLYPAFYLAAFQPVKVLKGKLVFDLKGSVLRNALVVLQFAAGILLIIGTITVYKQLDFVMKTPLGYNRDQVLVLHNTSVLGSHARVFKEEVLSINGVENGTMTDFLPNYEGNNTRLYAKEITAPPGSAHALRTWYVDADFIPTLEIDMLNGRNFFPDRVADSTAIIVNPKAAKMLGYTADTDMYVYEMNDRSKYKILGVMNDFRDGSLKKSSEPLVLMLGRNHRNMAFKIGKNNNMAQIIDLVGEKYKSARKEVDKPFRFTFLDQDYAKQYDSEEKAGKLFLYLSTIAVILACLGLVGLLSFSINRKMKEIGIRKVLGAKMGTLYLLLTKKYLTLIGLSMLIAFPLGYLAMNKWLQDFAYRIPLSWWIFAGAGSLMLLVAIMIVSFQVLRAAKVNPVLILKAEE